MKFLAKSKICHVYFSWYNINFLCRCNGEYTLVIYQCDIKPHWLYNQKDSICVRYGHIEGIDADRAAYATQASEIAVVIGSDGSKAKMEIMKENFNHSDEHLYIGFNRKEIANFKEIFQELPNSKVTYSQIEVQFEVKHSYFNNLIRSVNNIAPDIINRLLPVREDFLSRCPGNFQYTTSMQPMISQLDSDDQLNALKTVAVCPTSSPPVLINGSFGTGKSRVLAIAAYYISETLKQARILVCAHHQASVDHFVETYFGDMIQEHSWNIKHFFHVTPTDYHVRSEKLKKYSQYFMTFSQLKKRVQNTRIDDGNVVITTTFLNALHLHRLPLFRHGFFTHILLDEGAQSREPEAIAPLSLASKETQIVIAGDSNQVLIYNNNIMYVIYLNTALIPAYIYPIGWSRITCPRR